MPGMLLWNQLDEIRYPGQLFRGEPARIDTQPAQGRHLVQQLQVGDGGIAHIQLVQLQALQLNQRPQPRPHQRQGPRI